MNLSSEYRAQFGWRDWFRILDQLPPLHGQVVLDLGCGVGDLAAELVDRGARVIGFDINEELLQEARSRQLTGAEFRMHDLREPLGSIDADGIWCSFATAYFPELQPVLLSWAKSLKPDGWIALTEIDDLLGHEPVSDQTRETLAAFAEEAFAAGGYDFHMGRKLVGHLESAGFAVTHAFTVEDQELSFDGPASPEVMQAWRNRFERMPFLRKFCASDFPRVRTELLDCLTSAEHLSVARVHCCIATK
jgi:SAM-dependent methyltransferase